MDILAEYNRHMKQSKAFRSLTNEEIRQLKALGNSSSDWTSIKIQGNFDPHYIRNSRIEGSLELVDTCCEARSFRGRNFRSGLESVRLEDCRLEGNAAVYNCDYLKGYQICSGVFIASVKEMIYQSPSTFGQGFINAAGKAVYPLEAGNELGSRWVLPQAGMLPPDIRLWAGLRGNAKMMEAFQAWSSRAAVAAQKLPYAPVAADSVIKNCSTLRNVQILGKALISGALRLEELSICGSMESPVIIEEGSDLRWGILQEGTRVSHSIAEHFYLGAHSTLSKGARFIHSVLSENSTLSCCEVVSVFTGAFHEQHHNNSFLIASMLEGQSNIAAGATIGSNHNSRSADGEIRAGRGFWPALDISLKHNSRFASFTLITRGQYPYELNIDIPFSLVSQTERELHIMPAYWQQYNLYGLTRNSWKFKKRDKRNSTPYLIETHWLAPDTLTEILQGLNFLEDLLKAPRNKNPEEDIPEIVVERQIAENSKRPLRIIKPRQAASIYRSLIHYNLALSLLDYLDHPKLNHDHETLQALIGSCTSEAEAWINLAGTPISNSELKNWQLRIEQGNLQSWEDLHRLYLDWMDRYPEERLKQALCSVYQRDGSAQLQKSLQAALEWEKQQWEGIQSSRNKDVSHPFRHITYDSPEEQEVLQVSMEKDPFLQEYNKAMKKRIERFEELLKKEKLHE